MPLRLAVEPGLCVKANRELLGRALSNLIDNALKYGQPAADVPGVMPEIVLAAARVGGMIELSVADHGPGVPDADRERVTERFVRLDRSRAKPGFGLGLSLVAAITKLHGGQMRLEDNAPGLRVVLVLPAGNVNDREDVPA